MLEGMKVLVAFAEGYHSNAIGCGMLFLPADTPEDTLHKLQTEVEYSFSELDGKHSETEASITLYYNYSDCIEMIEDESMDYLMEIAADYIPEDEREGIADFNKIIHDGLSVHTETVIKFQGDLLC